PMVSPPDQARTEKAFKSLALLVSLDVELSNTARLAHYVVPDLMCLETPAVSQFTDASKHYGPWPQGFGRPAPTYAAAAVDPPGGSDLIEIWQVFYEVAKRLDRQLVYHANAAGAGEHWDKLPEAIPLDLERRPTAEQMYEYMCT